jgi:signal transduction histidine kinase
MTRITSRFVMLIATAAVGPLVLYGVVSVRQLGAGTRESVTQGNTRVAQQAAEQIREYVRHNERVLRSIGQELQSVNLEPWQQSRILKDYVLQFPEFREITLFDAGARVVATSRAGARPRVSLPDSGATGARQVYIAPLRLDNDGLPTTIIAVRIERGGTDPAWLIGEIQLEELWRMVDRIRIGRRGFAMLISETGRAIAHGNPDKKRLIASAAAATREQDVAAKLRAAPGAAQEYTDERGETLLAVSAPVADLGWTVVVEQAEDEALEIAYTLRRQLLLVIAGALLATIVAGTLWGRSFITRIFALTRATRAIAEGRLDQRVALSGRDEIRELGDAFNSMADRLVQLQEDVRKQERQAMFGRIAAGLVHDLSHPIQTIGNNCKIIQRLFDDAEYRDTFKRTIDREMQVIKRVLDDLRNIARPIPLEHFPVEVDRTLGEVVDAMQPHAETAGLTLRAELNAPGAYIEGDVFALGRVYRNLIINAIQATAPGGLVVVATEVERERVHVRVQDTGCGIPPDRLNAIFEDFVTTKRRGLGLGLAIARKIVEQLGGRITVASEVGKGTTFTMDFPRTRAKPLALVVG